MTKIVLKDIPYERQTDPTSNRMCGAASLAMVLQAHGIKCTQEELWPKISKPNSTGQLTSRSYLLAREALQRGLSALVVQSRNPLRTLQRCHEQSIPVVLNHRLNLDSPAGHYSVLVGMGEDHALMHDPLAGPSRRVAFLDLIKLWQTRGDASEITGNVLIALAQSPEPVHPCSQCGAVIPESFLCPGCRNSFPLQPGEVLGCVSDDCTARTWKTIFCPFCDLELSRLKPSLSSAPLPVTPGQKEPEQDPTKDFDVTPQLDEAFGMIDALIAGVLASPQAMANPMIKNLVGELQAKKAEFLTLEVPKPPPLSAFEELANAPMPPIPAPEKPPEVAEAPKPIDGHALGRQLLVELGLQDGPAGTARAKQSRLDDPQLTPNTREIQKMLKKRGLWK